MIALFVVGPPGVGKTAVVREMIGFPDVLRTEGEYPRWTVNLARNVAAAGHYTGATFDGADTVPYSGASRALSYWEDHLSAFKTTIFDGDRFSHSSALARVSMRAKIVCVLLTAPADVLDARRAARGSQQNAAWMKGRATKAERFAALCQTSYTLAADSPPGILAQSVWGVVR